MGATGKREQVRSPLPVGKASASPASDDAPTTVHLVRHGQTDWNVEGRLQGWTDIPLNAVGLAQARAAARALADGSVRTVISSDLSRALQTAELIAAEAGADVRVSPALREHNYGTAEGQLRSDLEKQYGGETLDELRTDPDFAFPGGESRRATYTRVSTFLHSLLAAPPAGAIVLVSHGGALRVARGILAGLTVQELPRWKFANGEIVTLQVNPRALTPCAEGTIR